MKAKKLVNEPASVVDDMLAGYVAAYGDYISRVEDDWIIRRSRPKESGKVGIVIGNGSGHEPIAAGWVGRGMLDANALGDVFTAPPPDRIARAIREVDSGAGVLLLISNHSGDVINGEMAVELARAEGTDVEALIMYDDISSAPKGDEENRRGGPGTTFIYKLVGAAAEEGIPLRDLHSLGERVRDNTRTLGAALAPGTSPITGKPMFELPEDEVFIGMGVHGEPGFKRLKMASADEIVRIMVEGIIEDLPFGSGDEVLAFVNGSGGTTLMELLIAYRSIDAVLTERGIRPYRPLVGEYITVQETAGFSVSLCRMDAGDRELWDAPTSVPFFHR